MAHGQLKVMAEKQCKVSEMCRCGMGNVGNIKLKKATPLSFFKALRAACVAARQYKLVIKPFLMNWVFAVESYSLQIKW